VDFPPGGYNSYRIYVNIQFQFGFRLTISYLISTSVDLPEGHSSLIFTPMGIVYIYFNCLNERNAIVKSNL
jgi:hypothetical protein